MGKEGEIRIGLTGHRPHKLWGYDLDRPEYERLQERLELIIDQLLVEYKRVICHSGLALGADTIWSIAILNKREEFPERVFFHAEIPFMGQSSHWFGESVDLWNYQVETADEKSVYLEGDKDKDWSTVGKYGIVKALDDRNKGMVQSIDILIAIYDGSNSGTGNAVNDAKKLDKYILEYRPKDFE